MVPYSSLEDGGLLTLQIKLLADAPRVGLRLSVKGAATGLTTDGESTWSGVKAGQTLTVPLRVQIDGAGFGERAAGAARFQTRMHG